MALAEMPDGFSRREAAGMTRLGWAFVISIIFHLLCYGIYEGGKRNHIWEKLHWAPNFLTDKKTEQAKKKNELALVREQEPPPLMFVDVSAAQAVQDAPKNAKYYSDRSSVAANVKADRDTGVPKIEGKQTDIPKAADVPRNKVNKPQAGTPEVKPQQVTKQAAPAPPAAPAPKPAPQPPKSEPPAPKPEPQPAKPAPPAPKPEPPQPSKVAAEPLKPAPPARPPGELAMAKPAPAPQPAPAPAPDTTASPPATAPDSAESQPAPKPRPRTIEAALAQYGSDQLPGFKMKQDGGVRRESLDPGFDVAASPFGAYDRALIEAISQRWYSLLDAREYASDSRGKVVVEFCLHYDGRVTDVNIAQNSVGDMLGLICAKAISDPAPYAVWPADMRRQRGNFRYIQFTFFYY